MNKLVILIGGLLLLAVLIAGCNLGQKPFAPLPPIGPLGGTVGTSYTFSSYAVDPDGDKTAIRFAWGDGQTTDWSAFLPILDSVKATHAWTGAGIYKLTAQAKDANGNMSGWSDTSHIVIIP